MQSTQERDSFLSFNDPSKWKSELNSKDQRHQRQNQWHDIDNGTEEKNQENEDDLPIIRLHTLPSEHDAPFPAHPTLFRAQSAITVEEDFRKRSSIILKQTLIHRCEFYPMDNLNDPNRSSVPHISESKQRASNLNCNEPLGSNIVNSVETQGLSANNILFPKLRNGESSMLFSFFLSFLSYASYALYLYHEFNHLFL